MTEQTREDAIALLKQYETCIQVGKDFSGAAQRIRVNLAHVLEGKPPEEQRQIERSVHNAFKTAYGEQNHYTHEGHYVEVFAKGVNHINPERGVDVTQMADDGINFPGSAEFRSKTP